MKKLEYLFYDRLKDHLQMNNDPHIRQLLMGTLMRSGSNEEMLQQFIRNYP
jgi:hypothetical protein